MKNSTFHALPAFSDDWIFFVAGVDSIMPMNHFKLAQKVTSISEKEDSM